MTSAKKELDQLLEQAVRDAFGEDTKEAPREAQRAAFQRSAEKASEFVRNLNQSTRDHMAAHADIPHVEEVSDSTIDNAKNKFKDFANSPAGQCLWGAIKTVGGVALLVGTITVGARLGSRGADMIVPPKH